MKTFSDIKKIAILGAGVMGPGMALTYANGGYDVSMWTRSQATREKALETIKNSLNILDEAGMLLDSKDAVYGRIRFEDSVEAAVKDADYIQETIVERREAKDELYALLKDVAPKDAIIASNTSMMNVFEIAPKELLPRLLICHWYAPPEIIPLVEVVKSEEAPAEYAEAVSEVLKKCNKTVANMKKFVPGYIVNRLQGALTQEVMYLLDNDICDAKAIDDAVKASFIPRACVLGLVQRLDFAGLDMQENNFINHSYTPPRWDHTPKVLKDIVDAGNLGVKTGKGFYDYSGLDINEVKAKRDKRLLEMYKIVAQYEKDPISK